MLWNIVLQLKLNQQMFTNIDSSKWELSKGNVQPIKQGRKTPNLTAALTPCGGPVDGLGVGEWRRFLVLEATEK